MSETISSSLRELKQMVSSRLVTKSSIKLIKIGKATQNFVNVNFFFSSSWNSDTTITWISSFFNIDQHNMSSSFDLLFVFPGKRSWKRKKKSMALNSIL